MNPAPSRASDRRGISTRLALLIIGAALFLSLLLIVGVFVAWRVFQPVNRPDNVAQSSPEPTPSAVVPSGPTELPVNVAKDFQFVKKGWPMKLSTGQSNLPRWSTRPPAHLRKPPSAEGEVLYVTLPLGNVPEEQISVAMVGGEQLYFDDNGNGDFSDDAAPCPKLSCNRTFSVAVQAQDGTIKHRPYYVWFWYIATQGAPRFYSVGHYTRDLRIGTETFPAVVFEQKNHSALLRDDGLWIDLNRDGQLTKEEHFMDGDVFTLNGQPYKLALQSD